LGHFESKNGRKELFFNIFTFNSQYFRKKSTIVRENFDFKAFRSDHISQARRDVENLKKIFDEFDINKDGRLSCRETNL